VRDQSVLISGAGIAGPTLAYWLAYYGFKPTLVERAPRFRESGYVIDLWGPGYDIAEKMGLLPDLERRAYRVDELRFVNDRGKRVGGFRQRTHALQQATCRSWASPPRQKVVGYAHSRHWHSRARC
jgi:2-polyprenyl-6-methoxyphenol hydroxylase-like FAD-dependent oxidoreductase